MVYFTLHLSSNKASFKCSYPQKFLDNKYEIGLLKLDGELDIDFKINIHETNNILYIYGDDF